MFIHIYYWYYYFFFVSRHVGWIHIFIMCVCVCVWKGKGYWFKSKKKKKEHRQLLSKSKRTSILNKPTKNETSRIYIPHAHTYIGQRGMRKKTTDKHTEANHNSWMK